MTGYQLLLVAHIGAAIVFVGTVTAATGRFPRAVLLAQAGEGDVAVAAEHHRVARAYGTAGLAVPVLGVALAQQSGRLASVWVLLSLLLLTLAGALLALVVLPAQRRALEALERADPEPIDVSALRAASGSISLLWAAVLVLMVVKPW